MKYRATIILFLISFLLAGLYFFYLQPSIEEKKLMEDFEKRFFRAETSDIEFLRLDAGRGPITISKSGQSWEITKPAKYVPDLGAIESLFKALAKGRLIKMVGNAEDLDQFGFKTTYIILSMGYKGTIDVLRIAGESPSAIGHYAFSERLGKIFLVNKEFVDAMNLKPLDLREKRLFLFDKNVLGKIKIERENDTVELEKRIDGWHMVSPAAIRASHDEIESLIETLHTQKVEAFLEWKPEFAKLKRHIYLNLSDMDGNALGAYDVYFRGKEWDKGILIHRSGENEASRVRRDFWLQLDSDHSKFVHRNLFNINQHATNKITIKSGTDTFLLEQKDGAWYQNGSVVNNKYIQKIINVLSSWKAEKLLYEKRNLGQKQFYIEATDPNGTSWIEVTNFNMDYEIPGAMLFVIRKDDKMEKTAKSGKVAKREKVDFLHAHSSNIDGSIIVSSANIIQIIEILKDSADD